MRSPNTSIEGEIDGLPVRFIGLEAFVRNKRATGRLRDAADADELLKQS